MSDTLIAAAGILLCGALLAVVLRDRRPEIALCLGLAAGAAVLLLLLRQALPLLSAVRRMADTAQIPSGYLAAVLKATGITLLTQLTADTCRDAGETALAAKAELVGRVLLLAVAVPLFEDLLTLVTALMSGQEAGG